jgi:hypothetical protein
MSLELETLQPEPARAERGIKVLDEARVASAGSLQAVAAGMPQASGGTEGAAYSRLRDLRATRMGGAVTSRATGLVPAGGAHARHQTR